MKKFLLNYSIVLLLGGVLFFTSCSDDENPLPVSTSEFVVATIAPEAHLPVYFENNSLNAAYYVWDFGDGETDSAKSVSISHTYDEAGDYTVKLRAYNEDGLFTESEKKVDVGERFLTGMAIVAMGTRDGNGNKIDTAGIEAMLFFGKDTDDPDEFSESLISTDTFDLGGNFLLPEFSLPFDYVLGNEAYFVEVDMLTEGDPVVLSAYSFNPLNPNITLKDEEGTGGIILPPIVQDDGYQFLFTFEIR